MIASATDTIRVVIARPNAPSFVAHIVCSLETLYAVIATNVVQIVPIVGVPWTAYAYVDEDGHAHGHQAPNRVLYGQEILGPMVMVGEPDGDGNESGLTAEHADLICGWLDARMVQRSPQ
jgi:hypothetical protein